MQLKAVCHEGDGLFPSAQSNLELTSFDISSECSAGVIRRGDPYTPNARVILGLVSVARVKLKF